jgi:hypothetical protein
MAIELRSISTRSCRVMCPFSFGAVVNGCASVTIVVLVQGGDADSDEANR